MTTIKDRMRILTNFSFGGTSVSNFITRLLISCVFILVIVFYPIPTAQILSIVWGILTLTIMSYFISKRNQQGPLPELLKHIGVAILVIVASRYVGDIIHRHLDRL